MFNPADKSDTASSRAAPTGPCAGLANEAQSLASGTTVAAVITPPGRGALATVRVIGTDAIRIVAQLCRTDPKEFETRTRNGRLWIGHWNDPGDEPVVVYVGQSDSVEIHSHGGLMPAQTILRDLTARGVLVCAWQDLSRRESKTLIEAEAALALAQAPSLRTAAILLDQLHGALSNRITELRGWLEQGKTADVTRELDRLLGRASLGLHLISPWRVAIVGRPNVGKSSLLNALVGFDRAIIHSDAGTTRDLVTATTAVDGWPVEFCDSAGIRSATEPLETAGIERARRAIAESDWQMVVLDRSQPISDGDHEILEVCPRPIVVVNKIDLPAAWTPAVLSIPSHNVSAHTGSGLDQFLVRLTSTIVPDPPEPGDAVPFTSRQTECLRDSQSYRNRGDVNCAKHALERCVTGL